MSILEQPPKKQKPMLEQHYTPAELAKRWGFSTPFVRELFGKEEGVLASVQPETQRKRGRVQLRIPESVAERVYARLARTKRPTLRAVALAAETEEQRRA